MASATDNWSERRGIMAQRVAAVLYGVIAIITAELAVQPGEFGYPEAALGALLVGITMTVTRIFVEVVKKETEIGAHVPIGKAGAIIRVSLLVMLFPTATALLIVVAALTTGQWTALLDVVLYLGMATVFVIGFLSSYILDHKIPPALSHGAVWLLLSLVLVAAKMLA
jgi:hypothetical protein